MIQIIACGNSLRRDDGAGLVLAGILEQEWRPFRVDVERISVHQLTPELAADIAWAEVAAVVFVDTRVTELNSGLQARPIETDSSSPSVGHYLDPNTLMIYAHLLYGKQPQAWQVTVPGNDFGHGEGLSSRVTDILARHSIEFARALALDVFQKGCQTQERNPQPPSSFSAPR
jgi:hydrogenase maturation protease